MSKKYQVSGFVTIMQYNHPSQQYVTRYFKADSVDEARMFFHNHYRHEGARDSRVQTVYELVYGAGLE